MAESEVTVDSGIAQIKHLNTLVQQKYDGILTEVQEWNKQIITNLSASLQNYQKLQDKLNATNQSLQSPES